MFNETKTLIVVYKDEMLLNQLRKLVETKDDTEEMVVGTKDGSVKIVSWKEKTWLEQKKNGVINNKVLFLGDIKDTDKLIPVLDIKFDKYGVKYGWAGNQAVLTCDTKELTNDEYQEFLKVIEEIDIPEVIKKINHVDDKTAETEKPEKVKGKVVGVKNVPPILANVKKAAEAGADVIGGAFNVAAKNAEELTRNLTKDRAGMKRQQLFYGVVNLYLNDLETFINS